MAETKAITPAPLPEFFALNGRYVIAPDTRIADVGEDVAVLLEAVEEALQSIISEKGVGAGSIWPALYLTQQARGLYVAFHARVNAAAVDLDQQEGRHD